MSQNDLVIDNQSFPATRSDINSALQALGSLNSGPSAPSTTYANMLWYDTANNTLKMRSEANDQWINVGYLDQSADTFTPAGLTNLSQAQAEDDTSTVFGQVSGERLAQAVAANETPQSAPTTTEVLSATAGATAGGVGTYAFLYNDNYSRLNGSTTIHSVGSTHSGSVLDYAGVDSSGAEFSSSPSGTWRLMGYFRYQENSEGEMFNEARYSLYLRIS